MIGKKGEVVIRPRNSYSQVFFEKTLFKNLERLHENNCAVVFFDKVAGLWPATLFIKRLRCRFFPVYFA